jgi:hypothetical protein
VTLPTHSPVTGRFRASSGVGRADYRRRSDVAGYHHVCRIKRSARRNSEHPVFSDRTLHLRCSMQGNPTDALKISRSQVSNPAWGFPLPSIPQERYPTFSSDVSRESTCACDQRRGISGTVLQKTIGEILRAQSPRLHGPEKYALTLTLVSSL